MIAGGVAAAFFAVVADVDVVVELNMSAIMRASFPFLYSRRFISSARSEASRRHSKDSFIEFIHVTTFAFPAKNQNICFQGSSRC